jgi:AraC-like DNA-binding protein
MAGERHFRDSAWAATELGIEVLAAGHVRQRRYRRRAGGQRGEVVLGLCVQGRVRNLMGDLVVEQQPGDLFWCRLGEPRLNQSLGDQLVERWYVHCRGRLVDDCLLRLGCSAAMGCLALGEAGKWQRRFRLIHDTVRQADAGGGYQAAGRVLELLFALLAWKERVADGGLRAAVRWDTPSVQAAADEAGLSVAQFTRRFRAQCGRSPWQQVLALRIAEAQRLLCDDDADIQDIARRVGFADPGHFSKCFRRLVGCTPSRFRGE